MSQLFDNRYLTNDLEDQDEKNGDIKYYFRKVLGQELDKPNKGQLDKVSGDLEMDDAYKKIKLKNGNFTSPKEGIQLIKTIGNINPNEIDKHMNEHKIYIIKKIMKEIVQEQQFGV